MRVPPFLKTFVVPHRMKRRRKSRSVFRYPLEFKEGAVMLSTLPGLRVYEVAEMLMIHPQLLVAWRSEARAGPIKGAPASRRSASSPPVKRARRERAAQEELRAVDAVRRLQTARSLLQNLSTMRNRTFTSAQDLTVCFGDCANGPPSQADASDLSLRTEPMPSHSDLPDSGRAKTLR